MELGNLMKVAYGIQVITGAYTKTNNEPNRALQLLKDRIEELKEDQEEDSE